MNTEVINSKQQRPNQFQHVKANSNINKYNTHKNRYKIKTNMGEDSIRYWTGEIHVNKIIT